MTRMMWLLALIGTAGIAAVSQPVRVPPSAAQGPEPLWFDYRIVNEYPHDPRAFTQGLLFRDGYLFESTGLYGQSTLRKVRLDTGEVVREHRLPRTYFGEGLTAWGDQLIQLTWRENVGFVYDLETFALQSTFTYPGEGWGLTNDGERLIMTDGTAYLRFLEPETFAETGRLLVTDRGRPVPSLNELMMVKGELFANVWGSDHIMIIDPSSGQVTGRVDLTGLLSDADRDPPVDVLNGIAYDADGDRLFVTGKLWPKLFEIQLVLRAQ